MRLLSLSALALLAPSLQAQSTIYGMDLRQDTFFQADTSSIVNTYNGLGANSGALYALDFDATATTLWAVDSGTLEYGTLNLTNGSFLVMGTVTGPASTTGMTAAADGTTWYLSEYDSVAGATNLYSGDVTTGTFNLVGPIAAGIIIDIAIDSQGNLYGHSISDDSLYSIDTSTGLGTLIGGHGLAANFAQGMDFDWTTDLLYVTVYTGGGTGTFGTFDLATGALNVIEDTTPTNAEMEIAIQQPAGGSNNVGTNYCTSNVNSTGSPAVISATGSASISTNNFTLEAGPVPNQPGLFYYGPNQIQLAFGNGFRCVGGFVVRLNIVNPTGNVATEVVDLIGEGITPGAVNFQYWFRDPAGGGAFFDLSDGLEVTFTP